jgi:hypothetical protein
LRFEGIVILVIVVCFVLLSNGCMPNTAGKATESVSTSSKCSTQQIVCTGYADWTKISICCDAKPSSCSHYLDGYPVCVKVCDTNQVSCTGDKFWSGFKECCDVNSQECSISEKGFPKCIANK